MTYFYSLHIFSVQVLKDILIKSQYLKYQNDITELEGIFFFLICKKIKAKENKCLDQSFIMAKQN